MRDEEGETAKSMSCEGRFLDAKNAGAELDEATVFVVFVFGAGCDNEVV